MKQPLFLTALVLILAAGCTVQAPPAAHGPTSQPPSATSTPGPSKSSVPSNASQAGGAAVTVHEASLHPLKGALQNLEMTTATFATNTDGWVVGTYGSEGLPPGSSFLGTFVARTTDGGGTWRVVDRLPGTKLTKLDFLSPKIGYAIGGDLNTSPSNADPKSILYRTSDGGQRWTKAYTANGHITDVSVTASGTIWLSTTGPCTKKACAGSVWRSTDAGAHVSRVLTSKGPVLALSSLGNRVWAEVVVSRPAGGVSVHLLVTEDGGRHWSSGGTLSVSSLTSYFTTANRFSGSVSFTSADKGIATIFSMDACAMHGCSVSDVFTTTDGGTHWSQVPSVNIGCEFEPTVAATDSRVAVAQGVNLAACSGPGDTLFTASSVAGPFHVAARFQKLGIRAMGFLPSGTLWALGSAALMMGSHTAQGFAQVFPQVVPSGQIHFVNASVGYGAGDASNPGAILKTTDGGRHWKVLSSLPGLQATSFSFPGGQTGYVGAVPALAEGTPPAVLKTTDGGKTWGPVYQWPAVDRMSPSVHFSSVTSGTLVNLNESCINTCDALVMTTSDGGRHWHATKAKHVPVNVESATVVTPQDLVVTTMKTEARAATAFRSSDGGSDWSQMASLPPFVDGGLSIDFPIAQVGFIGAEHILQPGGNGKMTVARAALLKTVDGGAHWTLYDLPGLWSGWTSSASFISKTQGWVLVSGTVWTTTDGGASWTEISAP